MSYSENGNAAYERQELKRYIGMIRQAGMTD